MTYCFDLDGTLCTNTEGEYVSAVPFPERINEVKKLYDAGHTILIDTARGSSTGLNWFKLTEGQLVDWGCPYHQLRVGSKLTADIFIDDKGISDLGFFKDKTIGSTIDDYMRSVIKETLDKDKFPEYDNIYTDTFSELIDKLSIVHVRYWYLEDAMSAATKSGNDEELVLLRKKSESLFKEKRPMLVAGLDKLIAKMISGEIKYTAISTKQYKGWGQKE